MHERPIGDLVDALTPTGLPHRLPRQSGYPPLRIHPVPHGELVLDAPIRVRGDVSSQFLTALLLALPLAAASDITIEVVGELISKPYIEITLNLLARFGIAVRRDGWERFTIPAGSSYRSPGDIHVEADASSASYFIALGAIATSASGPDGIRIEGVGADSIQGDIRFVDAARQMGAEIDSGPNWLASAPRRLAAQGHRPRRQPIPDAAMTLAVMALYADGPSTLRNIASWRVEETDRIDAMANELRKLGATVEAGPDFIRVQPPAPAGWRPASIRTYDDHRVRHVLLARGLQPRTGCRCASSSRTASPRPSPTISKPCSRSPTPPAVPVIASTARPPRARARWPAKWRACWATTTCDSGSLYRVTGPGRAPRRPERRRRARGADRRWPPPCRCSSSISAALGLVASTSPPMRAGNVSRIADVLAARRISAILSYIGACRQSELAAAPSRGSRMMPVRSARCPAACSACSASISGAGRESPRRMLLR